ncbi:hypothetical protein CF642_38780, partial [Burkholderia pseudomallei]
MLGDASLIAARAAIRLASPSTVKRACGQRVPASGSARAGRSGPTPAGPPAVRAMSSGCGRSDKIRAGRRAHWATGSLIRPYDESRSSRSQPE